MTGHIFVVRCRIRSTRCMVEMFIHRTRTDAKRE